MNLLFLSLKAYYLFKPYHPQRTAGLYNELSLVCWCIWTVVEVHSPLGQLQNNYRWYVWIWIWKVLHLHLLKKILEILKFKDETASDDVTQFLQATVGLLQLSWSQIQLVFFTRPMSYWLLLNLFSTLIFTQCEAEMDLYFLNIRATFKLEATVYIQFGGKQYQSRAAAGQQ